MKPQQNYIGEKKWFDVKYFAIEKVNRFYVRGQMYMQRKMYKLNKREIIEKLTVQRNSFQ